MSRNPEASCYLLIKDTGSPPRLAHLAIFEPPKESAILSHNAIAVAILCSAAIEAWMFSVLNQQLKLYTPSALTSTVRLTPSPPRSLNNTQKTHTDKILLQHLHPPHLLPSRQNALRITHLDLCALLARGTGLLRHGDRLVLHGCVGGEETTE
jgi:hypothetical protein